MTFFFFEKHPSLPQSTLFPLFFWRNPFLLMRLLSKFFFPSEAWASSVVKGGDAIPCPNFAFSSVAALPGGYRVSPPKSPFQVSLVLPPLLTPLLKPPPLPRNSRETTPQRAPCLFASRFFLPPNSLLPMIPSPFISAFFLSSGFFLTHLFLLSPPFRLHGGFPPLRWAS